MIVDLLLSEFREGRLEPFVCLSICALNGMYGGVHLAAWNSIFLTGLEGGLWKISALCTITALPAIFLLRAPALLAKWYFGPMEMTFEEGHSQPKLNRRMRFVILLEDLVDWPLLPWVLDTFVVTRIYLAVEAFILSVFGTCRMAYTACLTGYRRYPIFETALFDE